MSSEAPKPPTSSEDPFTSDPATAAEMPKRSEAAAPSGAAASKLHDPDLDDLVRSLNRSTDLEADVDPGAVADAAEASRLAPVDDVVGDPLLGGHAVRGSVVGDVPYDEALGSPTEAARGVEGGVVQREAVAADTFLGRHLGALAAAQGSDLLLVPGQPPTLRVHGELHRRTEPPLEAGAVLAMFRPYLAPEEGEQLRRRGSLDFSLDGPEDSSAAGAMTGSSRLRLRVNLHRQRGVLAASVRALPRHVPSLAALNLPSSIAELAMLRGGLVLFCGPTGSGKSTSLAALMAAINHQRRCHVVTVEDPVEFEHDSQEALVEHVEIGRDAPSFAEALRSVLRQDPDVLLVGEMRDLETVSAVLTAAETGHLVLSTLHAHDAARAVHRIVDAYPEGQQAQVRQQLAQGLSAIVMQQLVPTADGSGRVPAVEILRPTYAVRQLIRTQATQKLYTEITLGKRFGMVTMEESLARWVQQGRVSREEALARSGRPEELQSLLA